MKKYFLISVMIVTIGTFVSCDNKNQKKEVHNIKKVEEHVCKNSDLKVEYLEKYSEKIVACIDIDNEARLNDSDMVQAGMNITAGKRYKVWDDFLNSIWKEISLTSDKAKFEKLKEEQNNWIKEKEKRKKEVEEEFKGGSMMPLQVNSLLEKLTKNRCLYLIKNYM